MTYGAPRRLRRVATFSEFNEDNDPYGEHDFGAFTVADRKFFFQAGLSRSEHGVRIKRPRRPDRSKPRLTIMLAEEY